MSAPTTSFPTWDWTKLPPHRPDQNECGTDRHDSAEHAMWALNGAEAVATVLQANIDGEHPDFWSKEFVWMLHQGQAELLAFARQQVCSMRHELWYAHALLGEYGEQNAAKAQRELASKEKA